MGDGYGESTVHAVAGAVAGGVARTVVSPLDVIKIRFQVFFPLILCLGIVWIECLLGDRVRAGLYLAFWSSV